MFEPPAEARYLSKSLWIVLLVASLVFVWLNSGAERALSQSCEDPGYATDHILVRMEDGASAEALDWMKNLNGEGEEAEFFPKAWSVDLPTGHSVFQAVRLYGSDPDVKYAEVDQLAYPDQPSQAEQNCPEDGASLQTSFTDTPNPVAVGEKLTYEISVRNNGPGPADNASVTTRVPEGATLVSSGFVNGAEEGGCPPGGDGAIKCRFGDLGVGESATLELVVRPTRPGNLSITTKTLADNPLVVAGNGTDTAVGAPDYCTIWDTDGGDRLTGTPGRDAICGFDGADRIHGRDGNDIIYGGTGDDIIRGGTGKDKLLGGDGDDVIRARDGARGNDTAFGGRGKDTILADPGDRARD